MLTSAATPARLCSQVAVTSVFISAAVTSDLHVDKTGHGDKSYKHHSEIT